MYTEDILIPDQITHRRMYTKDILIPDEGKNSVCCEY